MAQWIPSVLFPPRIFRAGLFQYFTYKYVYLGGYDDISMKNIFNTYALKRYVWFSLNHPPTPQYVLHLHRHNLVLTVFCRASTRERTAKEIASCLRDQFPRGRKRITTLFEEFEGKDKFFERMVEAERHKIIWDMEPSQVNHFVSLNFPCSNHLRL